MAKRSPTLWFWVTSFFQVMLMASSPAFAQPVSFAARRDVLVGGSPQGIAVGDFNRDGVRDVAVTSDEASALFVALGNGGGTYRTPVAYAVGMNPRGVAVGDFDGNGAPDLVVANNGSQSLSLFLGAGDGTFAVGTAIATGLNPTAIAVGTFDNDAVQDLAITNFGSHTVSVLLGNGNGTFRAGAVLAAGVNPTALVVGQLNAGTTLDLAVANAGSNNVSVFFGNGDGTFASATTFAAGDGPRSIAAGDLNRDGAQDLAIASFVAGSVSLLLGGGGTFTSGGAVAANGASGVTIGDLNGDLSPDLAVTDGRASIVSVMLGNGAGAFGSATPIGTGTNPLAVVMNDLNGDGKQDIATVNATSDTASVLLGNGDGTLRTAASYAAPGGPVFIATGDFNADSVRDFVTSNYDANTLSVLLGNADGTFRAPVGYAVGAIPWAAVVNDFDRDGVQDIAVANAGADFVSVLRGNGNGTFRPAVNYTVGTSPQGLAAGDLNTDGKIDLVAGNANSSSVSVLLGNGDGTFQTARHALAGTGPATVALGDLNGDGRLDVTVGNYYADTVSVLLGVGDGSLQAPQAFNVGNGPLMVVLADFNKDGALDLAAANYQRTLPSTVSVLLGNGNGSFGPRRSYDTGIGPASVAVADFDGDGNQDIAAPNYGSNSVPALYVSVLLGNGDGTHRAPTNFGASNGAIFAAVDDLNHDSKPDMIVANYGAGTASVLINNSAPQQQTVATPTFSPPPGLYVESVTISIATTTNGATIHYTTDGSAPTASSPVYTAPFALTRSATVRAMAVASGMNNSAEASASYTVQVATPAFSPDSTTFAGSITVTLSTTTSGATIHYTTNGSIPTTSSPVYSAPLVFTQTTTIRAIAAANGMLNSAISTATYTRKVSAPTFTPPAGTYIDSATVTLSSATPGATIYYTTDGSKPKPSSTQYTAPIVLTSTTTVRAMATANGLADSDEVSATYTIQTAAPSFNPAAGTYLESVTVALSSATSGATIYYTTNGTAPTTASPVYSVPLTITQTTTVQAMAVAPGKTDSAVTAATYTVQATAPTFNPAGGGTYNQPLSVTLSSPTSGAVIRYTIDGTTPTGSSPAYTGPISVTQSTTIRAMTTAPGKANSAVVSATYTLQAVAPTFSPPGGTFVVPQFVSISTSTTGATIYYTTDGSTPTTASTRYTGPILIVTTTTIRALAVVTGWSPSNIASATYTFGLD